MDLKEILSIAGRPGLYKTITQAKNGVIVESLSEGKRFTAFSHERISSLEEISIFTEEDDMPLVDVFKMMYEKLEGKQAIDPKSDKEALSKFFDEMIPEYDKERVYTSDIKKVITWYNTLVEKEMLEFPEEEEKEEDKPATDDAKKESKKVEDQPDEKQEKNEKSQ
ncbi:MAG: DUF5606 domain-containing protein [Bacteroidales bacterium]|nr:DUF5606 domain-containing protein [Bacteroidales bacterium]